MSDREQLMADVEYFRDWNSDGRTCEAGKRLANFTDRVLNPPKEVAEAMERLRRTEAGESYRKVYGFDDEVMDEFMHRMLENKYTRDWKLISNYTLQLTEGTNEVPKA